jgi:hypothetical protein
MAWNNDNNVDAEELQSIIKLVAPTSAPLDLTISIKLDGNAVQGEVPGKYGINNVNIFGYHLKFTRNLADNSMMATALWVGREVDAATAALSSTMKACCGKSKKSLSIELRAYRAGGGVIVGENQRPVLLLRLQEARIGLQSLLSNGPNGIPSEILAFTYRGLLLETSPQTDSGITGATRSCDMQQ